MNTFWQELKKKKPFIALAPMEEVTDVVFRELIAEIGRPDVMFTEFTSVEGMNSKGRDSVMHRLKFTETQRPIIAQIWGITPEAHLKAAREIVEMGFDGVDINMGCPVKKIVKMGACSKLIDNPALAKEIIAATKEGIAGRVAFSAKTRIGFSTIKTEEWCGFLLDQGLDALIVHGRIAKDQSKVPADWGEVAKVVKMRDVKNLDTVIIGNGDVLDLKDAVAKQNEFGVDGVMIGRGVFQDPYVFNPKKSISDLSPKERLELLLKHAKLFTETWGDTKNFNVLKRFFKIYIHGFDGASDLRESLMNCKSYSEIAMIYENYK